MSTETPTVYTIGFTRKHADEFFPLLQQAGVRRVLDIRLNNTSQLAGFTKREDLPYFLRAIANMDYVHLPQLAPSPEIFTAYKKLKGAWPVYEERFLALMAERRVEESVPRALVDGGCLLCSEPTPEHCHRRLVAEYLRGKWGGLRIVHL
jgi:uncharacterized protein (DUF488 family)